MKNKIYKYFFLLSVFSLFNFSCKNEPIFAAIEEEVKLKKQSIQGLVLGIIQIGNTVYSANPKNVFKKEVGDRGEWSAIASPGGMCTSLASDGTKLYATFLGYGAYVYSSNTWQKLDSTEEIVQIVSGQSIIGINSDNEVFKLTGITFNKMIVSGKPIKLIEGLKGGGGAYFADKSSLYSSDSGAKINLSGVQNIRDICEGNDADKVFILTSSTLFHYDRTTTTLTSIKHQVLSVWCISYSVARSLVLIGGSQGYKEIKVVGSSLAGAQVITPGSNSSTTPPSCYNQYNNSVGKWLTRPIALITTPTGYVIYAGIGGADPKYTGLWGFYNPSQLEWNRE
ncbi:MAG: hypothetical protein ACTTJ6_04785 [Treponema sp.]